MSSNNMSGFKVAGLGAAMNRRDKADLINAFKKKLQAFVDNDSDVLENLSPAVRNRVKELQGIQAQYDDLEAKFLEERASLEAKYQKLYEPFYIQRYEVVSGKVEVEGVTEKGVPNFWLNAMKNNDILAEEITKRDEGPLKFLVDIKWSRVDNPEGFRLDFHFDTNPFFKNSVLTKTYHMLDEDEPILDRAIGTEIEWYPGKCVTHKIFKKKPKKGADITEPIIKIEACESFFNFFSPTGVPEEDKDIEENDVEELDIMEQDYDIGATIRDEIIPHAVSWFTGEAAEDEFYEDEDEDADEEEDEEDEDEKVTEKKGGMAPVGEGHQG